MCVGVVGCFERSYFNTKEHPSGGKEGSMDFTSLWLRYRSRSQSENLDTKVMSLRLDIAVNHWLVTGLDPLPFAPHTDKGHMSLTGKNMLWLKGSKDALKINTHNSIENLGNGFRQFYYSSCKNKMENEGDFGGKKKTLLVRTQNRNKSRKSSNRWIYWKIENQEQQKKT